MIYSDNTRLQHSLRQRGKKSRQSLSVAERRQASQIIADLVISSHWFRRSKTIGCYIGTEYEVDTWPIIARAWQMKKRVFAPVLENKYRMRFREMSAKSTLEQDRFGLLEPVDGNFVLARNLDLVITPLVAYDENNGRIGMGGGYFDRSFSFLKDRKFLFHPKLIGLGFHCQKVSEIPANPWDVRLFTVVSER